MSFDAPSIIYYGVDDVLESNGLKGLKCSMIKPMMEHQWSTGSFAYKTSKNSVFALLCT